MSQIIHSSYSINYDNNNILTSEETNTSLQMSLEFKKTASTDIDSYISEEGLVGNERYIIFNLSLTNPTPFECKINSIIDTVNVIFPKNYTPNYLDNITVSNLNSNDINLNIQKVDYSLYYINISKVDGISILPNSELILSYKLILTPNTPINCILKDNSKIKYSYNSISNNDTLKIYENEIVSKSISISLVDGNKHLIVTKKTPEYAFYNKDYPYIIEFKNISQSDININEINNSIDANFNIDKSKTIVMLDSQLVSSSHYSINIDNQENDISLITFKFKNNLSLPKNSILSINIHGIIPRS